MSLTLKVSGEGVGGAITGAIGSSGGYGVYATALRLFVIRQTRNLTPLPRRESSSAHSLWTAWRRGGYTPEITRRTEKHRIFEVEKGEIERITLKKPVLLSGYLEISKKGGSSFRVYINHKKAYNYIENMMKLFAPGFLHFE